MGLHRNEASVVVPGPPAGVFAAVVALADRLWPGMTSVVVAEPPFVLVTAVSLDGSDTDCWLTWELAECAGGTHVRLVHEEADTSPGPPPELEAVLELLAAGDRPRTPPSRPRR